MINGLLKGTDPTQADPFPIGFKDGWEENEHLSEGAEGLSNRFFRDWAGEGVETHEVRPLKVGVIAEDPFFIEILRGTIETLSSSQPNRLEIVFNSFEPGSGDLVLIDLDLPGHKGWELCRHLKGQQERGGLSILCFSQKVDSETKWKAFASGAVDFISKPFLPEEVQTKIKTHLELVRLKNRMEDQVVARSSRLLRILNQTLQKNNHLQKSLSGIIQALALMVEVRDPFTTGHQSRVAELARAIAQELGWPEPKIQGLYTAAKIHDLGKILVPAEILIRPGKLSTSEYLLVQMHAEAGYSLLEDFEFPWPVARMVREHHERLDGSGYPKGLRGDALLPESRVLAVADVVEAISFYRPYRLLPFGIDRALEEIERDKGRRYGAEAVEACIRVFRQKGFQWKR